MIGTSKHPLRTQLEQLLEGSIDQAQSAVQILYVDHRTAVIDDLTQLVLSSALRRGKDRHWLAHVGTLRERRSILSIEAAKQLPVSRQQC